MDVVSGAAMALGTGGGAAIPGVGLIGLGVDQILTGAYNISSPTQQSMSAFSCGGYQAALGLGASDGTAQVIGALTPAGLSLGFLGWGNFYTKRIPGSALDDIRNAIPDSPRPLPGNFGQLQQEGLVSFVSYNNLPRWVPPTWRGTAGTNPLTGEIILHGRTWSALSTSKQARLLLELYFPQQRKISALNED